MADLYLLVHPERFPSNDWEAFADDPEAFAERVDGYIDESIGRATLEASSSCPQRLCILDETSMEDQGEYDELMVGVPSEGWTLSEAEPEDVDQVAVQVVSGLVQPGGTVLVGGYAREDCVRRSIEALTGAGYLVEVDERATLPLTAAAVALYPKAA